MAPETIKPVAEEAYTTFKENTRTDGSKYIECYAPSESWIRTMIRATGAGTDDWSYRFIYDALALIIEKNGDLSYAHPEITTSEYDDDLLAWLCSHSRRREAVDEVLASGYASTVLSACECAQLKERTQVFDVVAECLVNEAYQCWAAEEV